MNTITDKGRTYNQCSECGAWMNINGALVLIDCTIEARRVNEIDGFVKGVKSGERYPGERATLDAEWARIAKMNIEIAQRHYGHRGRTQA